MMPTRYEKLAGVIGCPYSIQCAMLKVKKSMNIFRYSFDPAATKGDFFFKILVPQPKMVCLNFESLLRG